MTQLRPRGAGLCATCLALSGEVEYDLTCRSHVFVVGSEGSHFTCGCNKGRIAISCGPSTLEEGGGMPRHQIDKFVTSNEPW
jgi:hypothetical protein